MIYFKHLGKVYIQHGAYRLEKKYRKGHVHVQGMENIVGDVDPATLETLPEYFVNGWAQMMYPVPESTAPNHEDIYDRGAYAVGIPVNEVEYINIPKFKPVHLFYFHSTSAGNNEAREVVQFDPAAFTEYTYTDGNVITAAKFVDILSSTYWESEQEYYGWLNQIGALRGFNRNAKAYPPGVTKSAVSELASYKGRVETAPEVFEDVTIHVTPMYIQNERPLFDLVYLSNDPLTLDDGRDGERTTLFPGRILKWYGGITSEWRHAINYDDHSQGGVAIATGSDPDGTNRPRIEDQIVIDGETYLNADAYNITRNRR